MDCPVREGTGALGDGLPPGSGGPLAGVVADVLDDPQRYAGSVRGRRQGVALHIDQGRVRRQAGARGLVVDEGVPVARV